MRVALVHYWLVNWRGGEKLFKAIADMFPDADIYTHVADPKLLAQELPQRKVITTFIARLPRARRYYQKYLALMPMALEMLDLQDYDLVISSESGPAKGVIVSPHATHVCYCHSPMRYAWDRYHEYARFTGSLSRMAMMPLMHYMRMWDQVSAQRVDHYIANSHFVGKRIGKYYGRHAEVIYPPVATRKFDTTRPAEDFYLYVGRLVPYKRADILVEACTRLGRRLIVIGDGEMAPYLKRIAGPTIELIGPQEFDVIRDHYARCRATLFAGVEDFGMVPVEAMASGKPVIAFGFGGARETVVDGLSGVLFYEPTAEAAMDAIRRFERTAERFDRRAICAHAAQFSEQVFHERFSAYLRDIVPGALAPAPEEESATAAPAHLLGRAHKPSALKLRGPGSVGHLS
ncbi:MAG TPA: glycosyltransferase [Steroidobacteraceae bacterium]|nr:glycosyltransferase [Steroidobacteraceae bacterium]